MMNLYKIDGGIGKNIMFTGLIESIVKKEGSICIETAYPEVFMNIPGVSMIYNSTEPKDPKKFYSYFKNVYAHDPYIGNMWKGDVHVTEAWAQMFGLDLKTIPYPNVTVEPGEKDLENILSEIGDSKYFIIQMSGGQSPYDIRDLQNLPEYANNPMRAGRNMGMLDSLYNELKAKFPDYKMVQFGLPNEPRLKDAIQVPMHYVAWFKVFQNAEFFVGIDSMMQHYMASIKKPGIVFWDMNTPEQFGWKYDGVFHYNTVMPGGVHIDDALAVKSVAAIKKFIESTPVVETEIVE